MKRRKFVFAAGISALTGAASTSLTKPALSSKPRELSMVTSWPKNFPGLGTSAARLGARISSMSDGKLRVNVYERGSLFQSSDLFRAAQLIPPNLFDGLPVLVYGLYSEYTILSSCRSPALSI